MKEKADGQNQASAYAKREEGSRYVPRYRSGLLDHRYSVQLLFTIHYFPQSIRIQRNFQNLKIHITRSERIFQCLRKKRTDGDRARFARALHANQGEVPAPGLGDLIYLYFLLLIGTTFNMGVKYSQEQIMTKEFNFIIELDEDGY
jgi:hypothetical protein